MKMTKSESGKLGSEKSKLVNAINKQNRISSYNLFPNLCLSCQSAIPYKKKKNKFCSHSCAGTYNNSRKDWSNIRTGPMPKIRLEKSNYNNITRKIKSSNKVVWNCIYCLKEHVSSEHKVGKFCNNSCQKNYDFRESINNWNNISPGKGRIKRYLAETFGKKCSVCGIDSWQGKDIVLELEHKDGNSENNNKDNVCLICPNCHSQTSTYKGKNKGNGRHTRRQRYAEGKSW